MLTKENKFNHIARGFKIHSCVANLGDLSQNWQFFSIWRLKFRSWQLATKMEIFINRWRFFVFDIFIIKISKKLLLEFLEIL